MYCRLIYFTQNLQNENKKILTAKQLHPSAGFVDGGGVAEEEERHTANAAQNEDHGQQHEERGHLKRA